MRIEATLEIDEVLTDRRGAHARGEIRYIGYDIIGSQRDNGGVEGSLTFHDADLKPGQRVKAVFTIIEE
jgi:hypothetical protein